MNTDLQPKQFKVKIKEKDYLCKPPRLSHRLIMAKVQPLFTAAEGLARGEDVSISAEQMVQYENELDFMIQDLIPELKGVELDILDIADLLSQLMDSMLPEDSKELKDSKVKVNDPKSPSEAKI